MEGREVEHLLCSISNTISITGRIDVLSRHFLGKPYRPNPLIGSASEPEVFTAALDGFDCVTYIEVVLALARASSAENFTEWLRKIRYDEGLVQWRRRNHYMTAWIRNNARQGIIAPVSIRGVRQVGKERVLNVVPGLAPRHIRIKCVPKSAAARLIAQMKTGDLIFFVSTRKNLDVFHAGMVIRDGVRTLMRHASRSQGRVVEQELNEFLKANRMGGVIVARPQEIAPRATLRTQGCLENSLALRPSGSAHRRSAK